MKHLEAMLRLKKSINSCINVCITNSLIIAFSGVNVKTYKERERKGLINQTFCIGAVVTIKVRENGPPIKIFHENDLLVCQ